MTGRILLSLGLVLLLGLMVACGGDDSSDGAGEDAARSEPESGTSSVDQDDAEGGVTEADMEESAGADYDVSEENVSQLSSEGFDRRVIRNGELELVVTDVNDSLRHAREIAEDYGGYVEASSSRMLSEESESASLTLEVPSDDFDAVMSTLREGPHVSRVEREMTDSRDVTEEYVDLESRLRNLESTEERFLALLDEAQTIDDVMSVEREISRIRGEIEEIQGRLNYLEERTDNSRINLTFHPDEEGEVEIAGQYFAPGSTARDAWNASMEFVGAFGNAVIAVVVFLWWFWPLALIGGYAFLHYRRRQNETGTTQPSS